MQSILREAKVRINEKQCQELLNEPSTTVRVLASLIDKISASSSEATVLTAPLYYRRWLCLKNRLFRSRPGWQTFVRAITLDRELAARQDLDWWERACPHGRASQRRQQPWTASSSPMPPMWAAELAAARFAWVVSE